MRRVLAIALINLLLSALPASAAVWHILPDGSGDAPTIAAGIQLARPGDVVELGCGTYHEDDIPLASGVTVRGETGDPACVEIVASGGSGFVCENQTDAVVEGLTVRNGNAIYGAGIYCYVSTLTVRDCEFRDGLAVGDGGITCYGSTLELLRCRFIGNQSFNEGPGGIWVRHSTATITDCYFADNVSESIGAAFWLDNSEVSVTGSTFVGNQAGAGGNDSHGSVAYATSDDVEAYRFEGCTMVANHGASVIRSDGDSVVLSNTLVAFNEGVAVATYTDLAPALSCCDLYGNSDGDWTGTIAPLLGQQGNIAADPLFCDLSARDLGLQPESPCQPEANPECGLIGAGPSGCAPTAVQPLAAAGPAVLQPAAPNPFNPRTTLAFDLAASMSVRLEILDLAGRRVALLRSGMVAAGHHEVSWTGRDDSGRALPSGLYLCRLAAGSSVQTQRLALVR